MKSTRHLKSVLALTAVLALGACANMNTAGSTSTYPQPTNSSRAYVEYGVVESIDLVRQGSTGVGGGAILGAVVGGILGNQVGGGDGKTAATVIGAAGGAYAGNELEKRNQPQEDAFKMTIRMRDGSYQTLTQTSHADIRVGDRVRVENGVARRY